MILCDIGNTTFNCLINGNNVKFLLEDELVLDTKQQIYFISVNDNASKKLLSKYPNAINLANYFDIQTKYANSLGIDRKALIYKAYNKIIIDAGSAISVDIIKNGNHLGGFLMPGIKYLSSIYPTISDKLQFDFQIINIDKLPTTTNEAINFGILNMLILPILKIKNIYNLELIFTGGDGKILADLLKQKYEQFLIFSNMKLLIKEKFDIIHKKRI